MWVCEGFHSCGYPQMDGSLETNPMKMIQNGWFGGIPLFQVTFMWMSLESEFNLHLNHLKPQASTHDDFSFDRCSSLGHSTPSCRSISMNWSSVTLSQSLLTFKLFNLSFKALDSTCLAKSEVSYEVSNGGSQTQKMRVRNLDLHI